MKKHNLFTLIAAAALMFSGGLALADDSLIVTLPGETFTSGTGNSGTPIAQTVGTAFAIKLQAVSRRRPHHRRDVHGHRACELYRPDWRSHLRHQRDFRLGQGHHHFEHHFGRCPNDNDFRDRRVGAMTPVASSSLQVNPELIVTLPGQTFVPGTGNSGTVIGQTAARRSTSLRLQR